jgi:hypothetical protein
MTIRLCRDADWNVRIGKLQQLGLGHHRKRTYGAERVAHLSSLPLFAAKPQLASSFDTSVLTCGDARTLKFTLIVQGMPM